MSSTEVEEDVASSSVFPSLMQRKEPVVLRKAAQGWGGQRFLENPGIKDLKTTWRLHPRGSETVLEANCRFFEASLGQFLEWERSAEPLPKGDNPFARFDRNTHWAYADYKHVKELAGDWSKMLEPLIDWSALGCSKSVADSTVWLGTEGSHTPLHHDTYGVNLVAQLQGRKKWLLFPPADTASLSPTRVPYEESSVFSCVDVRTTDVHKNPGLGGLHPLTVILEPGDVLYVPKQWWHFVEATETSLSVNVWIDAPDDPEDRAKEALARVLVTSLAGELNAEIGPGWLNPTEGAVWPLEETLQVAHLAFQGLNAHAEGLPHGDVHGSARVLGAGDDGIQLKGAFSVRSMVDAITAPDVLRMVMERISQGSTEPTINSRNARASPRRADRK